MNRIAWIDWAKALLIISMVIGHYSAPDMLKQYIYAFHMPAFFIISGYLYKPKSLYKVFISFLVPLTLFGLINFCWAYLRMITKGEDGIPINHFWEIPTMFPGYWFIQTLFICRMLSGDLLGKVSKYVFLGGATISSMVILTEEWNLIKVNYLWVRHIISCYPFFAFGYLLKLFNYNIKRNSYFYILALAIYVGMTYFIGRCDVGEQIFNYSYFLYAIVAVISSVLFFHLCSKCPKNKIIEYLSEGTLIVLGVHRIPAAMYGIMHGHPLSWIVSMLITVTISIVLIKIICRRYPLIMGKVRF